MTGVTFRVWRRLVRTFKYRETSTTGNLGRICSPKGTVTECGPDRGNGRQQYNYLVTNAASGSALTHVDPYSRAFKTRGGPSLIAPSDTQYADTSYTTPAWNEMVIYELHIGTFVLDKTLPRPGGTFDSAATKLDYLKDSGLTRSEIMAAGEFESDTSWDTTSLHLRNRGTIMADRTGSVHSRRKHTSVESPCLWTLL